VVDLSWLRAKGAVFVLLSITTLAAGVADVTGRALAAVSGDTVNLLADHGRRLTVRLSDIGASQAVISASGRGPPRSTPCSHAGRPPVPTP